MSDILPGAARLSPPVWLHLPDCAVLRRPAQGVEELIASGILTFDVDLDSDAI
jgi:hypothetical protein